MKVHKLLVLLLVILVGASFCAVDVFAADGNAQSYKTTVKRIELKNDAGSWVIIATPNQEIDLVGVAAGAAAASLLNDSAIPAGNYVNFKIVIDETFKVTGCDSTNLNCTKVGGSATFTGSAATAADIVGMTVSGFTNPASTYVNANTPGEMTMEINLDSGDADDDIEIYATTDLSPAIEIKATSTISMWFDFDTQGTIAYAGVGNLGGGLPTSAAMYFKPPAAGTEFSITVDGSTTSVTSAQMTMAF